MDSIHSPVEHGENPKEATIKTPHAILIALSLIVAAIFFKDTAVKPAHASGEPGGVAGFSCIMSKTDECYLLGNNLKVYRRSRGKWQPFFEF